MLRDLRPGAGSLAFLTPHIGQFYATFVVIGLVGNATTQMGYSRAVSTWFDARRGLALALVMSGTGVGSILLPAAAQWLIEAEGWRNAYLTLGGLSLFCGIPLTVSVRPRAAGRSHLADLPRPRRAPPPPKGSGPAPSGR